MKFSYYIAKRYFLSKSKNNAINIISYLALVGIFGTSLALFVVLSAFGGLKEFSLSFANKYDPDLKVLPLESKRLIVTDKHLDSILLLKGVQHASKVIEEKTLLNFKDKNLPAVLKAVDSNYIRVNSLKSNVFLGQWLNPNYPYQVVIGNGLSRKLSIGILDQSAYLNFVVPKPGTGQIMNPQDAFRKVPSRVRGIFGISEEYNNTYVFSQLNLARELLNYQNSEYSGIELAIDENADISELKDRIIQIFPEQSVNIKTRLQLNDELYKMLNTENLMVYLISTLVLIIALFNLIGAVIMAIIDKRENIKTLSYLGANVSQINSIFFIQGLLSTAVGSILGIIFGSILVFLQLKYDLVYITSSLAYPVKWNLLTLIIVLITTLGLGTLASKIASSRAAKLV
ncbi:ABC transporter permease [Flavobacteriaceae bacterium 14752]|uniref:ABC transporter permease n=1 Tax=Mesohalobacter salilacus TaxID=2491711 RepID=UPI000F63FC2F|nr:ABC transporter permease [Flavobacteriaceae bacterium 14752]